MRIAIQNSYRNDAYEKNVRASKIEGAAVHQQQHTKEKINDAAESSSTSIIHTIISDGGTVNKNKP